MRTIFLLLTVLAGFAAFAMPSQDEVIPEVEFFQPDELDAVETVAAMKRKGATDADCLKVSKALFTMVKNEVKTEQNAIDVAINGASKCNDKGGNEIAEALKEQRKQKNSFDSQQKKLNAKKQGTISATVQASFGEVKGSLNNQVSQASYLQDRLVEKVHAERWKVNNLKKKLDQTKGKGKEADKSVVKARDKAENAKKDCRCKSYKAYQAAVKDGEKNLERHSKAWAKAAAIECATMSGGKNCKTKAMAVVRKKPPPQGVNKEACPTPKNARPPPVNCKVSGWGRWGRCSKVCGGGLQKQKRHVQVGAKNGGKRCPALKRQRRCNTQACSAGPPKKKETKKKATGGNYGGNYGGTYGGNYGGNYGGKRQQCSVKMQHCTASDKAWKAFKADLKKENPHLDVSKLDKRLTNKKMKCKLSLERLQLNKLPESLRCLTKITFVSLYKNNIKQLPANVFKGLTSLTALSLTNNKLEQLPKNIFKGLTSLKKLYFGRNRLKQVPENAFEGLKSLMTLTVFENILTQLPENVFKGLTSLKSLYLTKNKFKQLPKNIFKGLTSLQYLYFGQNKFKQLPEFKGLTSLEQLIASENNLEQLPENVFKGLTSLKSLHLEKDHLKQLPENVFKGLTSLKTLKLGGNDLKQLPKNVFKGLPSLKTLILKGNKFKKIPENVFKGVTSLKTLYVRQQSNGGIVNFKCAKSVTRCK